jgi:hypothetical protein
VAAYLFTGPGTYVFPELAGPAGGGTLTTVPGAEYEFSGDPPGPPQWWSPVTGTRAASTQAVGTQASSASGTASTGVTVPAEEG